MSPASERRGRVLIVDDDPDLRESMVEMLAREGYQVEGAEHGGHAIELLRAGMRPDVILLDLMMPVMNGYEFRAQQRDDRDYGQIPVVVISADLRAATRAATLDAAAVLAKPVDIPVLLRLVRDLVAASRTPAA